MKLRGAVFVLMVAWGLFAIGQEPIITLHSDTYEKYGEEGIFTLLLGSTSPGTIMVDCGDGLKQYDVAPAVFDSTQGVVSGTYVTCQPTSAGNVTIYGVDGVEIDYFNGDGCEITSIEFSHPEWYDIISLRHNSIERLDLSEFCNLSILDLGDNPFNASPLVVGGNKPHLRMLALDMVDNLSRDFDLTEYPSLYIFSAYNVPTLKQLDPTNCPELVQLSIDNSNVKTLDVSKNEALRTLNVSNSGISTIDLSHNPALREFYADHTSAYDNPDVKFESIDLTHNPELVYLFMSGNLLSDIDVSHNPNLLDLYLNYNLLTSIDINNNEKLENVSIRYNYMDYSTLPIDDGQWLTYEYQQRALSIPTSVLLGSELNFAGQVLREDTETFAWVLKENPLAPTEPIVLDEDMFTYADGIFTFLQIPEDSVYIEFYNAAFPGCQLRTNNFVVKDESTYGKPVFAFDVNMPMLSTDDTVEMSIGMLGASEENPKAFYVDFGDGELQEFVATSGLLPAVPNVQAKKGTYGTVKVYMPDGETLTSIGIANIYLSDINLAGLGSLTELSLTNSDLYNLDLRWNRSLRKLVLTGNHFRTGFTLEGINGSYNKTVLEYIDLSNNEMQDVVLTYNEAIRYLDLSHNSLSRYNFDEAERIYYLNLSDNKFDYLKINYLSSLLDLDISNNNISEIVLPEINIIEHFNLKGNKFTLATMPDRNGLGEDDFLYAPQQKLQIAQRGSRVDLSRQCIDVDGNLTSFVWVASDGKVLEEGVDYEISNGVTEFMDAAIGKKAYCVISNGAYPAFTAKNALVTTSIEISGKPKYVIGEFVTTSGNSTVNLSLASNIESDAICIDWGDGEMIEYELGSTYRLFTAQSIADANVKVYSFEEDSQLGVFSISGVSLSDVNLAKMRNLRCLSISNAGISSIVMPESEMLAELMLPGCLFTEFDFSQYPNINYVNFSNNKFSAVDVSGLAALQEISFSNNELESITFGGNDQLWGLYLDNNNLETIDLTSLGNLYQVTLDNNKLETLDVDGLENLRVISISNNFFTFATLPLPKANWAIYNYGNQAPIQIECVEGEVDLSTQAYAGGVATTYHWSVGNVIYDPELGGLVGKWLKEGEDYIVTEGITLFLHDIDNVMCVMLNDAFPSAYMKTNLIDVTVMGLSDVAAGGGLKAQSVGRRLRVSGMAGQMVAVFTVDGRKVAEGRLDDNGKTVFADVPAGIKIVKSCGESVKVAF